MKVKTYLGGLLATTLFALGLPSAAEDIDLFMQPPTTDRDAPMVLFMVDNTANWSPMYDNEIAALVSTFENLEVEGDGSARFRVGVMFAAESGAGNPNNLNGGYVRAAVRGMTETNKGLYAAMFANLDSNKDKGNSGASGLSMAEAYRYFTAGAPFAGNGKAKADYQGNVAADWSVAATAPASKTAMQNIYALPGNALLSKSATQYQSPSPDGYCGKAYIIYISNGPNQESAARDTQSNAMLAAAGGSTAQIPISPSGSATNPSDEWARFMHESLGSVVYTLDVDKSLTGQGPGWTAMLKSMAAVSDGKYYDISSGAGGQEIVLALNEIFSKIQAVNSVFAAVSLPVSVNTEGTYLNQVFVGMFRPDSGAYPRWAGNLKQYKLSQIGNTLRLVDAFELPETINPLTGFIDACARSYWTPTVMDTYWSFSPQGNCSVIPAIGGTPAEAWNADNTASLNIAKASNRPDGSIVEKGAQAHTLRNLSSRAVTTCSSVFSGCTDLSDGLTDFDVSNAAITPALLGAADAAERDALIEWQIGADIDDENLNSNMTEKRPSVHGDVVHSRPVAVNFGTVDSPQVVTFYGGNDGVLRAINGSRSASIAGIAAGGEMWAFVAPEFYPYIKRLYDNSTEISFRGNEVDPMLPTPLPKPYGIDGPITVYKDTASGSTWIYTAMRRGGRAVYAFDVSDINTDPGSVSLLWKRGCPNQGNDTDCSTGFNDIGQTWAAPKVLKASGHNNGDVFDPVAMPMLIMGGGYDICEDADPKTCTGSRKGNKIYVMDASTGGLLKTFATDGGVVADVFVISDSNGLAKWAYAADLNGNVYRIGSGTYTNAQFGSEPPANWTMTKIASLGCDSANGSCVNRKFMFSPDVVKKGVASDEPYNILIGSGDREKPLRSFTSALGVANYFFMLQDSPTVPNWLEGECGGSDVICLDSLRDADAPDDPSYKGWRLAMRAGEQVVTSAITVFGVTTFSTHTPTVPILGACTSTLGTARVYNVRYRTAAPVNSTNNRDAEIAGGGLPPSPVAGMVTLDNGQTVPFIIGADPESPLQGGLPSALSATEQPKSLTYWFIEK